MPTYWLSMAAESGQGRVAIVDAASKRHAHQKAIDLKLKRSGDELLAIKIQPDQKEFGLPRDRILSEKELDAVNAEPVHDWPDAIYRELVKREKAP